MSQPSPAPPHNHSPTLPFTDLVNDLFEPLKKGPAAAHFVNAPGMGRIRVKAKSAIVHRDETLTNFFSKWRKEVGDDIYPAMRLICPQIDSERPVYGLKEQTIAKRIVKILHISSTSEAARTLTDWKNPGKTAASRLAGDFAGRCYEELKNREVKSSRRNMRISEVNDLLDRLAGASREAEQIPIFDDFYLHMGALELQWLIRIILKQMRVGASERSILAAWHPDAMDLFNVNSDLRDVCRQLSDQEVRLGEDDQKLRIMQNFMPQLAPTANNALTWDKIVGKLGLPAGDPTFWMEEKVDGERMQMHVQLDEHGDYRFKFWSRKGKDYTYLYGDSINDNNSALTRHLGNAFNGVPNCILDGEMIGFDPKKGEMATFGTLKTYAIQAQANPHDEDSPRPMFRIFDVLLFHDRDLTGTPLKERHQILEHIINDVPGRFEIHPHQVCTSPSEIEPYLRQIIQSSAEGIMLKNPNSPYELGDRPFHWLKIKPDYMKDYGETLDCVIIGGFYGTGRRGGMLSSFLCGLRASKSEIAKGTAHPEKFYSFFKVGGGIKMEDYEEIQRLLPEDKWSDWDPRRARQYIELAGGNAEKPDRWIRPSQSIVIEVKGASVEDSTSFSVKKTLRFPRFRKIRTDKSWTDALDVDEWYELRGQIKKEEDHKRHIEYEEKRKKAPKKKAKTGLYLPENDGAVVFEKSKLFEGLTFYIPSGSEDLDMLAKDLQNLVREHGGSIAQDPKKVAERTAIGVGDRKTVYVNSLARMEGVAYIISPKWLVDCVRQQDILPYEDEHLYLAPDDMRALALENTDQYGDSYHRDLNEDELEKLIARMKEDRMSDDNNNTAAGFDNNAFYDQLESRGHELPRSRGYVFRRCRVYLAQVEGQEHRLTTARLEAWIRFGGGEVAGDLDDGDVTHVVVVGGDDADGARNVAKEVNARVSERKDLKRPYVVTEKWLEKCWDEETLVTEDAYKP